MDFKKMWIYTIPILGIVVVGIGLYLAMSTFRPSGSSAPEGLILLADKNLQNPVETPDIEHESGVIGRFQRRTGVRVTVRYGSPDALIDEWIQNSEGDLLLVDAYHMDKAVSEGFLNDTHTNSSVIIPVAGLVPVILVSSGNPLNITELADLSDPEIRLAITDSQSSVLGNVTLEIFQKNEVAWRHSKQPALVTDTETGVVMAVNSRQADAAIVWRPFTGPWLRRTEIIEIPDDQNVITLLKIGVLNTTKNREQAVRFAEFMAGSAGREVFEMYGFESLKD